VSVFGVPRGQPTNRHPAESYSAFSFPDCDMAQLPATDEMRNEAEVEAKLIPWNNSIIL
jgi:hypothetical protein